MGFLRAYLKRIGNGKAKIPCTWTLKLDGLGMGTVEGVELPKRKGMAMAKYVHRIE